LRTLGELCQNPLKDLGTFARDLHWRLDSDIAGKSANICLQDLPTASEMSTSASETQNPEVHSQIDSALGVSHSNARRESSLDDLHIKVEYSESEDDLCGIGPR
jgi:hypothetical protein